MLINQFRYVTEIFFVVGSSYQSKAAPLVFYLAISSHANTFVLKNSSSSLVSFRQMDSSCLKRILRKRSLAVRSGPIAMYFTFLLERSYITNRCKVDSVGYGSSTVSIRCLLRRLERDRKSRTNSSFSRLSRSLLSSSRRESNIEIRLLKVLPW